jgi:hypothetical protein
MVSNDYLLQIVNKRVDFWRGELQAAFRSGDAGRAAECTRYIDEYAFLTALALSGLLSVANTSEVDNRD